MTRALLFILLLIATTPTVAQQQPDLATLQRAIAVLQQQRNQAMDAVANLEVQRALLAEEVERLKVEIEKLKKPE